ncbi:MAG: Ig-like domain-containing protein [Candidatus Dormibacteria bacterium]
MPGRGSRPGARAHRWSLAVCLLGVSVGLLDFAPLTAPAWAASGPAPVNLSLKVPASVSAGEPIPVSASLTSDGVPVPGRLVRFSVDGTEVAAADTARDGQAATTIRKQIPAGTHTVEATFAGSADFQAARATAQLTVLISTLTVHVVPAVKGAVTLSVDGGPALSADAEGYIRANLTVGGLSTLTISVHAPRPGVRVHFVDWSNHETSPTRVLRVEHDVYTQVAIQVSYLTRVRFEDSEGQSLSRAKVSNLTIDGPNGAVLPISGGAVWLTTPTPHSTASGALAVGPDFYSIRTAAYQGVAVAKRGQDRVVPGEVKVWTIRLDVYPLTLYAVDIVFGRSVGARVLVSGPAGWSRRVTLNDRRGSTMVLPAGLYEVKFRGLGLAPTVRVRVSRVESAPVKVFTILDAAFVLLVLLAAGLGLLAASRWRNSILARLPVWREALRRHFGNLR